jgi:hypothetical protein
MMKRNILYLVLALLVPFFMHFSTLAQDKEGGTGDNNTATEEKRDSEKTEAPADRDARPANSEQTPSLDKGDEEGTAA